jgi:hypothetical protein
LRDLVGEAISGLAATIPIVNDEHAGGYQRTLWISDVPLEDVVA